MNIIIILGIDGGPNWIDGGPNIDGGPFWIDGGPKVY